MKNKHIKIKAKPEHFKYIAKFAPRLLKYIERGNGVKIGHAYNHHTISFTVTENPDDEYEHVTKYVAYAYETKNYIVMGWGKK